MARFNSLGSNFSWRQASRALWAGNSKTQQDALRQELEQTYGGQVVLTYKGRQALQLALESSGLPKGAAVGINGFTCYVVYQAVERAGYTPLLIDVAKDTLHFDGAGLQQAHQQHPLAAVIVQNTFGIPCPITAIEKVARDKNLLVIEDLAHSIGAVYEDGRPVGTVGDFVMLSFSQDKTLDAVAGGACIDRRAQPNPSAVATRQSGLQLKLKLYPLFTHAIRSSYQLGLGRVLHAVLRTLHMLAAPMDDVSTQPQQIVSAGLTINRWRNRQQEFAHRSRIAQIYETELPSSLRFRSMGKPVYVRFPLRVSNAATLLQTLKEKAYYLGDTWYDAPLAPKKYLPDTSYQTGQCPEAEAAVTQLVNLPTHQEVSEADAYKLCEVIKQWQT